MAPSRASHPTPLLIIGGGRMGSALAEGWRAAGIAASSIHIVEREAKARKTLKAAGFSVHAALPDLAPALTLLAIKPQGFAEFAPSLGAWYRARKPHPLISILAGIPITRLEEALGPKSLVLRAMPNTPALVGEGVTGLVAGTRVKPLQVKRAVQLLGVVGDVVQLSHEEDIDALTALSGSGPAYLFYFLEAMIAAGVKAGLPEEVASPLAVQTVRGALALAEKSGQSFAELRAQVTSPGGTTEAGLAVLMEKKAGLTPLITRTVAAAARRSRQLGKG